MTAAAAIDDYDTRIPLPDGYVNRQNALVISATAVETFKLCNRKWWLRFWRDVPTPHNPATHLGTVLHAVCERWLLAEPSEVVECYPEGWDATLSPAEGALVKQLVTYAITEGILVRQPGRRVEMDFMRRLGIIGGLTVFVRGTMDLVVEPDLIEDHKTCKRAKYIKSAKALGKSDQPLIYANELLAQLRESKKPQPARITIQNNYFNKETGKVKKVVAVSRIDGLPGLTRQEIAEYWHDLHGVAEQIAATAKTTHRWQDIPDPLKIADACNAFGGCPYRPICGKRKSVEQFIYHINKQNEEHMGVLSKRIAQAGPQGIPPAGPVTINGSVPEAPKPAAKPAPKSKIVEKAPVEDTREWFISLPDGTMPGLFMVEQIQEMLNEHATDLDLNLAGTEDWKPASTFGFTIPAEPITEEEETGDSADSRRKAPWYKEGCTACSGNPTPGFASNGAVCRVCESLYGKAVSTIYKVWQNENATEPQDKAMWSELPKLEAKPAAKPVTKIIEAQPKEHALPDAPGVDITKEMGEHESMTVNGFTLCIGCSPTRLAGVRTIHIEDLLHAHGSGVAEAAGVTSYYRLNAFDRRDKLGEVAAEIAGDLKDTVLLVGTRSPDVDALVVALKPFADSIFETL